MEKWFGSVYEGVGSVKSDLLLKTRGQVKIQIGKKFIDLIKDGKLANSSDSIFNEIDSVDNISSEGIYLCDGNVYIKIGESIIQVGEFGEGVTYVSFLNEQNTTNDQKNLAKKNIGIQFDTLQEAQQYVESGIVFVDDKIYYIQGDSVTEKTFQNPHPNQIVINKSDSSVGALSLKGNSELNGILLNDSSKIFDQDLELTLDGKEGINLLVDGYILLQLKNYEVTINSPLKVNTIESQNFQEDDSGFKLDSSTDYSTLEVDRVNERDPNREFGIINSEDSTNYSLTDFPRYSPELEAILLTLNPSSSSDDKRIIPDIQWIKTYISSGAEGETITDEQYQEILNRLTALEGISYTGGYMISINSSNEISVNYDQYYDQ